MKCCSPNNTAALTPPHNNNKKSDARHRWTAENHLYNLTHRGFTSEPRGHATCPFSFYEKWVNRPQEARAASEAADLIYHAMVLLAVQGVAFEEVLRVLRARFGTSGVDEKAARPAK